MRDLTVHRKVQAFLSLVLCITVLLTIAMPLHALAAENNPKTIRVGFFAFDGYHEIDENGVRSGYGYDFLALVRRYANLNYEYVGYDKSWNDMQQMLLDGEIDLVTSAHRTPEREAMFEFSLPIGSNTMTISVRADETRFIAGDYETFDGMTIGLIEGSSSNSKVEEFAAENGFTFTASYYADSNALEMALQQQEVDAVAASSLRRTFNEKTIAEFNMEYFYAITRKGNTALIDEVNAAIAQMNDSEGDWMSNLFYQNYDAHNYSGLHFTQEEKEYIAAHSGDNCHIVVAFDTEWAPFSMKEGDSYAGILPDYWKQIMAMTGLAYETYGYLSELDIEKDLMHGNVDIVIGYRSDQSHSEDKGLVESAPFLTAGACVISRKNSGAANRIGVSLVNPKLNEMLQAEKGQTIHPYQNAAAAMEALRRDEVDRVFLYAYEGEYILNADTSGMLSYQIVPEISVSLCAVSGENENHILIGIVSKCVNAMSFTEVNTIIAKNLTVSAGSLTVLDYVKLHPVTAVCSAVMLAVLLMGIVFISHRNRVEKRHNGILEEKVNEITGLNERLVENQTQLEESAAEQEAQLEEITALNGQLEENQARLEEASAEQEAQLEENEILNAQLQAALKQAEVANRAKTDFLFSMSHDIRTPMNAIIGFANLMKAHDDDPDRCKDYLEKIISSSDILLDIINNVLEMARIESGTMVLDETTCRARSFYDSLFVVFEQEMRRKNIRYTTAMDIRHEFIFCDPVKLQELFVNILSNAVKYTTAGGSIHLELKELPSDREGWALMQTTITDTGIGMSKEFLPRIFDEFARERTVTENKIPGTGLGMPIVKKLVELMGGNITVESEIGNGTAFTVKLYHRISAEEALEKPEAAGHIHADFTGKRILLAEDNDLNAEIAVSILEDLGVTVEHARDGIECVNMINAHEHGYYELVLMDIQMPNLDGYAAAKRIRTFSDQGKAAIPIVAMTANAFEEDKQNALAAGMNGHLAKPIEITRLVETLESFL